MKIKILLINVQNPAETKYKNDPLSLAASLLGRRLSNYVIMLIADTRKEIVEFGNTSDVHAIQDALEVAIEAFEESLKESAY